MALSLKMIDLGKFNEIMEIWENEPTKDTGLIMLEKRAISKDQYQKIFGIFSDKKENVKNFDITNERLLKSNNPPKEDVYADNFTLRGLLGQGGIGKVFIGFDKNVGREVAIKELLTDKNEKDNSQSLARFIREAKVTGQLEHPGIIPVYELNTKPDGTIFYVMKYVRGKTLFEAIREYAAEPQEIAFQKRIKLLDNLIDVCEAMGYAHFKGIIHRDLKPSNIILGEFGETIILDWGLAKATTSPELTDLDKTPTPIDDESDPGLTKYGEQIGTPSYMAPEQIDPKRGKVDQKTDVYTLGVILFMILTGEKPYPGKGKAVTNLILKDGPAPSPKAYGRFIPPELSSICDKAMSKDKDKRFNNASELAGELKAYRDGRLVSVYAYSKKELFKRFVSHNKTAIIAAAAVVLSIMIGAVFSINFGIQAREARARADQALIDVTNLSESAMNLARNASQKLEEYYKKSSKKSETELASFIPNALSFDPRISPYQIWCMDQNGKIIYDEDPNQIGRDLFTDSMYTKFPELQNFGEQMREKPWGLGHYVFPERRGGRGIYKIAAWDTFSPVKGSSWRLVITYPYTAK